MKAEPACFKSPVRPLHTGTTVARQQFALICARLQPAAPLLLYSELCAAPTGTVPTTVPLPGTPVLTLYDRPWVLCPCRETEAQPADGQQMAREGRK